jgi:hypothetical protein
MVITITQQEISQAICLHIVGMLESATGSCSEPLSEGNYELVRQWEQKEDGSWRGINIHSDLMWDAYNAYGTQRIPEFISKNWDRAEKLFRIIKDI